ncbi:GNAT family N-acetyltransferase [Aureimonas pseudogalii]|uniref:Ribosomal-protein-alanine N-acetyltransferase n=1 Tax=Aureimonas pseudogalii TaxID=1744844 RepID=A0A7W6MK57_9HYPH|nr:GNAT family protein [Aureimonas pseudogalii]MBB3998817.1 ribosomal-protein-alanine N-acetyltransferase [Aureimonas pseudogalii]
MRLFDWTQAAARPVLAGRDVTLRMPRLSDYEAWRSLREESRSFLMPWEPLWSEGELTRAAFRLRLRRYHLDARERTGYTFFVFDATGRRLQGGLTLGRIQRGVALSATLGYWMGARYAGQGVMSRAVETVCLFAFEVEQLHRIEAACLPSNARSIRLLEKSGFRREGYLRDYLRIAGVWEDHHLYSLLVDDWSARNPPVDSA